MEEMLGVGGLLLDCWTDRNLGHNIQHEGRVEVLTA